MWLVDFIWAKLKPSTHPVTITHASLFQKYTDFLAVKIQYDCTNGKNLAEELQNVLVCRNLS